MLNTKLSHDNIWHVGLLFCLAAAILLMPELSFSSSTTDDGISTVLCLIVTKLTGPIGKTVSMIALVTLGVGVFMG